jgi:oligopeptide transport system substrate-binding protein
MIKFKSSISLSFFILFCFALVSCTQKSSTASKQSVLRMRLEAEPPTIDWTTATDALSRDVIVTLHEGLVRMDKEGKIVPNFAESWKVSPNGKTFTFKLRANLKWSDGSPLLAQHFVDAVERTLTPSVASEYAYFLFDLENAENFFNSKEKSFLKVGVKAPDSNTVVYTLRSPAPYWINVPAFSVTYPIRKDLIAQNGDRWTEAGKLVTAGPYLLREWVRESKLSLVKNPYYWDQEAQKKNFDEIEFRVIKENAVAVTLFERKEVDIVRKLSPLQVPMLSKKEPGFTKSAYLRSMAFGFGMKNPLTKDKRVRMALAMSVDRVQIKKFMSDLVEPTQSWIPEGLLGADSQRGMPFNPEKAKKLWAEIKNPPNKGLEYWYPNDEMHKMVAEFLQSEWKKNLGIDVALVAQEWKVFLKSAATQDLPIFRQGWGADYADSNNFLDMFTCSSGNNYPKYCNAAYEKFLKDALNTQSPQSRSALYSKAEKMLIEEDVAIAPIFQENNLFLVNPRLKGFAANKMGEFRLADVKFQEQNGR